MRYFIGMVAVAALVFFVSCTDAEIARAQKTVDASDVQLARAQSAEASAEGLLAEAKQIAAQVNSVQAQNAVEKAASALAQVQSALDIAKTTNEAAHSAVQAAKDAQAAGGSSISVIGAAAVGFLPGLIATLKAGAGWIQAARSLRQTVVGLDAARDKMDPAVWDTHVAPALSAAQDEQTKQHIALIQAKNV